MLPTRLRVIGTPAAFASAAIPSQSVLLIDDVTTVKALVARIDEEYATARAGLGLGTGLNDVNV